MTLITEELLEKALSYERPGDQQLRQYRSTVKAVLELVANDIIEACAKAAIDAGAFEESEGIAAIRSLKTS